MEPNLRDTPLRRFNTFFWGLGLFLVFGVAYLLIKFVIMGDRPFSVDSERGKAREIKHDQVKAAQAVILDYKKEGSSVQVPPSALFSMAGELLQIQPEDSGVPHKKEF